MRFSFVLASVLLPVRLSAVAHALDSDNGNVNNQAHGQDDYDNSSSQSASSKESTLDSPSTSLETSTSDSTFASMKTLSGSTSASLMASAPSSTSSSVSSENLTELSGDSQCSSDMCVSAIVNESTVEYVLQSTGSSTLGWMAMGFGSQMANTPMVIMWANSDGSVTLSQRIASGEVEPSVDSSPPRTATLLSNLTSVTGSTPKFGFSVPTNSDTQQSIIWAFSSTNPDDSSVSANLQEHDASGQFSLDLSKPLSSSASATDPASSGSGSSSEPLQGFQKLLIAHAVLLGTAFLVLLPAGALLARWLRTFSPQWFKGHWIIQFCLAGALIVPGITLGIAAVSQMGSSHLNDDHKRWGIAIFVLWLAQCTLGAFIHFVKPSPKADGSRTRPPRNYGHAVIGLLVIGLAFYQVRTGYKDEWPKVGQGDAPNGVDVAWIVWAVLLPLMYAVGLSLLPRQYRQEAGSQIKHGVALGPLSSSSHVVHTVHTGGLSPVDKTKEDGLSSHGHDDPYAETVGLTHSGRHKRRSNSGLLGVSMSSQRF